MRNCDVGLIKSTPSHKSTAPVRNFEVARRDCNRERVYSLIITQLVKTNSVVPEVEVKIGYYCANLSQFLC